MSATTEGEYYRYCDVHHQEDPCECKEEFTSGGTLYTECTLDNDTKEWCYVAGGDKCEDAYESDRTHEEYYKYCDPCACKGDFVWNDVHYDACTVTAEGEHSWCYVEGGSECPDAKPSTKSPGNYYIEDCGHPCDCKDEFTYKGTTYDECTMEEDTHPWCYIQDGTECTDAKASTQTPGEFYRYCDHHHQENPCHCKEEFTYKGDLYTECTDVDSDQEWCYVAGGVECNTATKSEVTEGEYFKYCDPCACKEDFVWNDVHYDSCTVTEEGEHSWCYVVGGSECPDAKPSSKSPGNFYIEDCGHPCDCKDEFTYKGTTYDECTMAEDTHPWCYIQDGTDPRCTDAMASSQTP